eukprot:767033-Hanusia_phi.AAC.5
MSPPPPPLATAPPPPPPHLILPLPSLRRLAMVSFPHTNPITHPNPSSPLCLCLCLCPCLCLSCSFLLQPGGFRGCTAEGRGAGGGEGRFPGSPLLRPRRL